MSLDKEFLDALNEFIADFEKERGLSYECAVEVLEAKADELRAILRESK